MQQFLKDDRAGASLTQTVQLFNLARRTVWRIKAAYAKDKVHEQRGAAVGSGSTDRNRRTFSRTDASDITTVRHCTGRPRSSKEDWRKKNFKYKFSRAQMISSTQIYALFELFYFSGKPLRNTQQLALTFLKSVFIHHPHAICMLRQLLVDPLIHTGHEVNPL